MLCANDTKPTKRTQQTHFLYINNSPTLFSLECKKKRRRRRRKRRRRGIISVEYWLGRRQVFLFVYFLLLLFSFAERERSRFPSHRPSTQIGYWAVKIHTHTQHTHTIVKIRNIGAWGIFSLFFMFHFREEDDEEKAEVFFLKYIYFFFFPPSCTHILGRDRFTINTTVCVYFLLFFFFFFFYCLVYFYDTYSSQSIGLAFNAPIVSCRQYTTSFAYSRGPT